MNRWLSTVAILTLVAVPLSADITVTYTMSGSGGGMAMAGAMDSRMVLRIKGSRARADVEMGGNTVASISDLPAKQIILLRANEKTAQTFGPGDRPASAGAAPASTDGDAAAVKPTGQSREIDGVRCDEYVVKIAMDMSEMTGGGGVPPEAAEMMKGVRMVLNGSLWIARAGPGTADYLAFQKAAAAANMTAILTGAMPGARSMGIDRLTAAFSSAPGLPYLTETTITIEGSGQMADMMKNMGAMKMTSRLTALSQDPIPDDLFQVPADYRVVK
jgi:hypothetical protein